MTPQEQLKIYANEVWKDIEGYEGYYQVSDHGRVKSLDRYVGHLGKNKALKKSRVFRNGWMNKSLIVCLSKEDQSKGFLIYRLVAKAFIPNPLEKPEVNHLDGNRYNNHISNLEWATRSENEKHAYDTGLYISRKGSQMHCAKLNESQISEIKDLFKQGVSRKNIASAFKIDYSQACKIIKGSSWKHLHIPAGDFINKSTLKTESND